MGRVVFAGPTITEIFQRLTSAHIANPPPPPDTDTRQESDLKPTGMLTVEDVMTRYRILDPRSARREIRHAGGRKIGGRWQIRLDTLLAWESNPDPASQLAAADSPSNHRREPPTSGPPQSRRTLPPLTSDWLQSDRET